MRHLVPSSVLALTAHACFFMCGVTGTHQPPTTATESMSENEVHQPMALSHGEANSLSGEEPEEEPYKLVSTAKPPLDHVTGTGRRGLARRMKKRQLTSRDLSPRWLYGMGAAAAALVGGYLIMSIVKNWRRLRDMGKADAYLRGRYEVADRVARRLKQERGEVMRRVAHARSEMETVFGSGRRECEEEIAVYEQIADVLGSQAQAASEATQDTAKAIRDFEQSIPRVDASQLASAHVDEAIGEGRMSEAREFWLRFHPAHQRLRRQLAPEVVELEEIADVAERKGSPSTETVYFLLNEAYRQRGSGAAWQQVDSMGQRVPHWTGLDADQLQDRLGVLASPPREPAYVRMAKEALEKARRERRLT
ncbi:hypothetical protein BESB_060230 [Besnoitia besnoiti]|uniref:Transmembrane protein n=1 Tax=Besnoitia besnoiti TaxID=94643 RepID=A0A2A9MGP4_BESBE|nr:hypothetical protein BESB_060230 [Besnoitia besnoiti]PFH35136.1 hypothetical protein BESB_060230 [Besnoitia besnoiti]